MGAAADSCQKNYLAANFCMVQLQNEFLEVELNPKGAELTRIHGAKTGLDYLWKGDPAFWGKHSPVLFPIVGTLKNNSFQHKGHTYTLGRHGFARDLVFELENHSEESAVFRLASNESSKATYPFEFVFKIGYQLRGNQLLVNYEVQNPAEEPLLFSVGGHPAFALPLVAGTNYNEYSLEFDKPCNWNRWPISAEGLIESAPFTMQEDGKQLKLSHELFQKDAIVFKHLQASRVKLVHPATPHGWEFDFSGFPYLGLWAAKNADFVCVEPWCGIADSVDHNSEFADKEGIIHLPGHTSWSRSWSVRFY